MERGFVLTVVLILAAAMFAGSIGDGSTGMASKKFDVRNSQNSASLGESLNNKKTEEISFFGNIVNLLMTKQEFHIMHNLLNLDTVTKSMAYLLLLVQQRNR